MREQQQQQQQQRNDASNQNLDENENTKNVMGILINEQFITSRKNSASSTRSSSKNNNLPTNVGYLTFLTATFLDDVMNYTKHSKILAVLYQPQQQPPSQTKTAAAAAAATTVEDNNNNNNNNNNDLHHESLTQLTEDIYVYTDSIVELPKGISDEDAISTASAALSGVHCGRVTQGATVGSNSGKVRIVFFVAMFKLFFVCAPVDFVEWIV